MNYINLINKSLLYIEEHIRDLITPEDLANHVMYSVHHFSRLFSEQVGLSIKQYSVNRRVKHVLYQASTGKLLTDAIFEFGFDSYSGFYKACHRTYGLSPKVCLKTLKIEEPTVFLLGREKYPMLTETKVKKLLSSWPVDQSLQAVFTENQQKRKDIWEVRDHTVMITKNYNKVLESIRISEAMNQQGIETPQFIKNNEGDYYKSVEDYYLVVKERFAYKTYSLDEIKSSRKIRKRMGGSVAKLHLLMTELDDSTADESNAYDTVSKWAKDIVMSMEGDLNPEFYDAYEAFKDLSKKIPSSIIHRNMHLHNLYFKDHVLMGYGDFHLTQKDVRLFDICYLATSILSEMTDDALWFEILKDLIKGYNQIVKLTKEEYQSLPYIIYSIQMIFIAYFKTQDGLLDLAQKNLDVLSWLYNNRSSLNLA